MHAHDRRRATGVDVQHGVLLADVHPVPARVVEQQPVELRADHLEGVRPAARIFAEPEAPRLWLSSPEKCTSRLAEEAVLLDCRRGADRIEDRQGGRQQRFADVVAREPLALEEDDPVARVGEHRRRHGSRGASADDCHVGRRRGAYHWKARRPF